MNPSVRKLTDQRTKVIGEIASLKAEIGTNTPTPNDAENLASLEAMRDDLSARITRLEQTLAEARLTAGPGECSDFQWDRPAPPRGRPAALTANGLTGLTAGQAWAVKTFNLQNPEPTGFETFAELLTNYKAGVFDGRMMNVMASHKEASGSAGGFVVPEQFLPQYLGNLYSAGIIWPLCEQIPMATESVSVPGWDDSSAAAGSMFGGITAGIVSEGNDITESTGKMRSIKLIAKKLATYCKASNELNMDAPVSLWPSMLLDAMTTVASYELDRLVLRGTGAGEPLGLLNAASKIRVTKENNQAATTLVYANVCKMWARMHPRFSESCIWLASPTLKPSLEQLTIVVGVGGSVVKAVNENEGRSTLLGRPIYYTEHCSALGTEGDIILVAPKEYFVGMRQNVLIESSRHVAFVSDETGFRSIMRVDGQPKWASAYTPRQGDSLSWAVTLETRS